MVESAATATIPRRGGLTAGSPSFGLTPAGPSGAAASPAGGNFGITPSGTGGALAALATPARSTLSRPDTPDGVISANLVDFKDVAELQQQNPRLLRALSRANSSLPRHRWRPLLLDLLLRRDPN